MTIRMNNLTEQCEEIEALSSIYGDQFKVEVETNSYSIQINTNVKLFVTLTENYPSSAPPSFELLAPILNSHKKNGIRQSFQEIYEDGLGGPILFQWIEKLKEVVEESVTSNCNTSDTINNSLTVENTVTDEKDESHKNLLSRVTHGETILDRKSVFQGHACTVNSMEEIKDFMNYLLMNKKISQATHNISAYRIVTSKGTILQDCNDDGENHAGGRLLHLLEILNIQNVMVVVSRWYGGIQLGPDRFKHINNAARLVLAQGDLMSS